MATQLDPSDYPAVKLALQMGYKQHTIAAFFGGINQGRISTFKNSLLFLTVVAAAVLPAGFPPLP